MFLAWGEIYGLFSAITGDLFMPKYASANYGTLYTAKACLRRVGAPRAVQRESLGGALAASRANWLPDHIREVVFGSDGHGPEAATIPLSRRTSASTPTWPGPSSGACFGALRLDRPRRAKVSSGPSLLALTTAEGPYGVGQEQPSELAVGAQPGIPGCAYPCISIPPRPSRRSLIPPTGRQGNSPHEGLAKDPTCHTLRHSWATSWRGCDIQTIQELLDHKDVTTTMIFTHVLHEGGRGVRSRVDGNAQGGRSMKISARNAFKGRVKQIKDGNVNAEVVVELPGGIEVVSIITKHSAEGLELAVGKEVYAVIKASDVMIGVPHEPRG